MSINKSSKDYITEKRKHCTERMLILNNQISNLKAKGENIPEKLLGMLKAQAGRLKYLHQEI